MRMSKKRPVFVIAIVDQGNVVVSGPRESHIENASTVRSNPMWWRRSVFAVQLDAQACSRAARSRTTNGKHAREKTLVFCRLSACTMMREKFVV